MRRETLQAVSRAFSTTTVRKLHIDTLPLTDAVDVDVSEKSSIHANSARAYSLRTLLSTVRPTDIACQSMYGWSAAAKDVVLRYLEANASTTFEVLIVRDSPDPSKTMRKRSED